MQSGDVKNLVPHPCVGGAAFSPNSQFLIYTPFDDTGCEKGESYVLRVVSIEEDDDMDELVCTDNWVGLDTVISPDGVYLATNAQGSNERIYPQGDENDINPRIVTVKLARPVPEFGGLAMTVIGFCLPSLIPIIFVIKNFFFASVEV